MTIERDHATGYTPDEVEAAKRVIIEIGQNLGENFDACVIVGGWVPELLLPDADPQHTGSIDVDLALNPKKLRDGLYATLLETLMERGYKQGEKSFQLYKNVVINDVPIRVDVDFLAPRGVKLDKNSPKLIPGFRILEADGCRLVFDSPKVITVEGEMPNGRPNRIQIQVASIESFLVMKGFPLAKRDKPKDAYDIYFTIKNFEGGAEALAELIRPKLSDPEVVQGLRYIAEKFARENDFGPSTVEQFLWEEDPEVRAYLRRDAFGQVHRLLDLLGILPN